MYKNHKEMKHNNKLFREFLQSEDIAYYEAADCLGVNPCTLSIKLRKELPEAEQRQMIETVREGVKSE